MARANQAGSFGPSRTRTSLVAKHIFPLFTVWFCPCTHHKERRRFFQRANLLIPEPTPSNRSGDLPHGAASSSLWTKEHHAYLLILRHRVFL